MKGAMSVSLDNSVVRVGHREGQGPSRVVLEGLVVIQEEAVAMAGRLRVPLVVRGGRPRSS